jgi:hypothetical protein
MRDGKQLLQEYEAALSLLRSKLIAAETRIAIERLKGRLENQIVQMDACASAEKERNEDELVSC